MEKRIEFNTKDELDYLTYKYSDFRIIKLEYLICGNFVTFTDEPVMLERNPIYNDSIIPYDHIIDTIKE